jgi:hypothetical protein
MYNPESLYHDLQLDACESEELLLETIGFNCERNALTTRLCIELVDCEPSIY